MLLCNMGKLNNKKKSQFFGLKNITHYQEMLGLTIKTSVIQWFVDINDLIICVYKDFKSKYMLFCSKIKILLILCFLYLILLV